LTASVRDGWLLLETRPVASGERELLPGVPLRWGAYELTLEENAPPLPPETGLALRAGEDKVTVRPCPAGERLTLPGSNGSRTLKRLCNDRRISLRERDTLPAFYVAGRLAAVWRIGTDAAFVPGTPERRFIRVKYPVCGK